MKICTVKHHFNLWFLIHHMDVLPFDGNWNNYVALFDNNGNLLSEIRKQENSIFIDGYGLELTVIDFEKILANPDCLMLDFVKSSQNIIKFSDDEYQIAKFAKENRMKYGYVTDRTGKLSYFIVNPSHSCPLDSRVFIDPNNPFV